MQIVLALDVKQIIGLGLIGGGLIYLIYIIIKIGIMTLVEKIKLLWRK